MLAVGMVGGFVGCGGAIDGGTGNEPGGAGSGGSSKAGSPGKASGGAMADAGAANGVESPAGAGGEGEVGAGGRNGASGGGQGGAGSGGGDPSGAGAAGDNAGGLAGEGGQGFGAAGQLQGGAAGAGEAGARGYECADDSPAIGNIRVPVDYATIQAAIDVAQAGDTVSVGAGTYQENLHFAGRAIRLVSEQGASSTIIDGRNLGPVVTFDTGEQRDTILEGFTLKNGKSAFEGGIKLLLASPTIIRNVFVNNHQGGGGFGAGIGGNSASPWIEGNFFSNNDCDDQFLSGVVAFVNGSSPVIVNNLFINNPCRAIDMTIPKGYAPKIVNNTLVNNHMGIHVDARVDTSAHTYANNIIVGGDIGLEVVFAGNHPFFVWSHNLVYGNTTNVTGITDPTGNSGNISVDPKLADIEAADLHVLAASPTIDAGVAIAGLPTYDIDGQPRVVDGDDNGSAVVDIGADEFAAGACR